MKLYVNVAVFVFKTSFVCSGEGGVGCVLGVCAAPSVGVGAVNGVSGWIKRLGESVSADKGLLMYQPAHLSAAAAP